MKPVATASMLIRRPPREVFEAFLDPATLTRFWLSRASGRLEEGRAVTWEFMVPGAVAETRIRSMTAHRQLVLEWDGQETAEFAFDERPDGFTGLEIRSVITENNADDAVEKAIEATQGYTMVVCNLKALLESGQSARLVEDKAILITARQSAK